MPKSLLELLGIIDGTYWREYAGKNLDWLKNYIGREFEDVEIDEKITDQTDNMCWLNFSNCMNNGGTSKLFIDFSPSVFGIKGQKVMMTQSAVFVLLF